MYGLVLQGGGGKGSYQIGVWKALRELKIEISAVTGTSIGALNGALIAQGSYDEAVDMWLNMDPSKVFNVDSELYNELMNFQIDFDNMHKYFEYFKTVFVDGGLDTEPLQRLIDNLLDEDKLRNSDIDFGLVTVNLTEMKPLELFIEDIPKGKVNEYFYQDGILSKATLDAGIFKFMVVRKNKLQ